MKNIIVRRSEEECCDNVPEAIVIGIERNDEKGYREIWMDPENAIEIANDILRLFYIALYRFHNRTKSVIDHSGINPNGTETGIIADTDFVANIDIFTDIDIVKEI